MKSILIATAALTLMSGNDAFAASFCPNFKPNFATILINNPTEVNPFLSGGSSSCLVNDKTSVIY